MAISLDEAMSAYGFVYQLANATPALKTYLDQAVAGSWAPEKLTASIESSPWWMQNADKVRDLAIMQATEPGTYQQNLANAKNLVSLKAAQLGRSYTDADLTRLALSTLTTNASWDDQVLSQLVANSLGFFRTSDPSRGDYGSAGSGTAAEYQQHLTKVAADYGMPITQGWLDAQINDIQSGRNTMGGVESLVAARAKAAFPHFASQIDAGMTVRDIADPYISTYAKTLEVPESEVTLQDSYIQKALSQSGPDGTTRTAMPLWQFQRTLKDDPRYDSTQQAKSDAFTALAKVGKDFGFQGAAA